MFSIIFCLYGVFGNIFCILSNIFCGSGICGAFGMSAIIFCMPANTSCIFGIFSNIFIGFIMFINSFCISCWPSAVFSCSGAAFSGAASPACPAACWQKGIPKNCIGHGGAHFCICSIIFPIFSNPLRFISLKSVIVLPMKNMFGTSIFCC